jgi:hypothetical protein
MPSSGILCHVALVRTDVSEGCIATIIWVTRIGELGTTLATSNREVCCEEFPSPLILVTLMMEAIHSSKTSVRTGATWCNFPEDGIVQINK